MAKKAQHGGKRPGAGRPPKDDKTVVIAASIPGALASDLDSLAKAKGWSRSRAVTEALLGLLERKSRA